MSQIEWAMWANELGVSSSFVLMVGSAVCISGMFSGWQFGIYGIIASLLVLIVEWPRSKRQKGSTVERQFQRPFTIFVNKLGLIGRNYFVRFVLYLLMCIPCCFTLATLLAAVCLILTAGVYLLAGMKGEEWSALGLEKVDKSAKKRVKSLHPPKKPPPRVAQPGDNTEVSTDNITMEIVEETPKPYQPVPRSRLSPPSKASPSASATSRPTRPPPRPSASASDTIQEPRNS